MKTYPEFIQNLFTGKEVHIVASGPSLHNHDLSYLKDKTVIAINHAYKTVACKYVVFNDANFLREDNNEILKTDKVVFCGVQSKISGNNIYSYRPSNRFSLFSHNGVYSSRSSGLSALTIALQGNADKIYLHGYDYKFINGKHHSTGDKYNHTVNQLRFEKVYSDIVELFNVFPREKIVNMSAISAIKAFEVF
jgi:hypothetical protein